jgi:hypothetical protein
MEMGVFGTDVRFLFSGFNPRLVFSVLAGLTLVFFPPA